MQSILKFILLACMLQSVSIGVMANKASHCLLSLSDRCQIGSTYEAQYKHWQALAVSETSATNTPNNLLSQYYALAMNNKKSQILALYSQQDDSYALFEKALSKTPNKFAQFNKVKMIETGAVFQFQNYHLVLVKWFAEGNQELAQWQELVQCSDGRCYMSERLMKRQDNIDLWMWLVDFAGANQNSQRVLDPGNIQFVYPEGAENNVTVDVSFKGFNDISKKEQAYFNRVAHFITAIQANQQSYHDLDSQDWQAKQAYLTGLFAQYWSHVDKAFTVNLLEAGENPFSSYVLVGRGTAPLFTYFSSVKKVTPLGLINADAVAFLFVNMIKNEQKQLVVFAYDKATNKLITADKLPDSVSNAWHVMNNPIIYERFIEALKPYDSMTNLLPNDTSGFLYAPTKANDPTNSIETSTVAKVNEPTEFMLDKPLWLTCTGQPFLDTFPFKFS